MEVKSCCIPSNKSVNDCNTIIQMQMNAVWVHTVVIQMQSALMWTMAMNATAENLSMWEMERFVQVSTSNS